MTLATWMPKPAIIPARCPRSAACDMMNITFGPGGMLTSVVIPMNNRKLSGSITLDFPALVLPRTGCGSTDWFPSSPQHPPGDRIEPTQKHGIPRVLRGDDRVVEARIDPVWIRRTRRGTH